VRVGNGRYDLLAMISAAAFLVALACTLTRAVTRPEESWYAGRAAAESARTLGWCYAVGGTPFALDEPDAAVEARFLERLRDVVDQLKVSDLGPPDSTAREITEAMRRARRQDLPTRRTLYRRDRITDQLGWYARRSTTHAASARRWIGVVIGFSALGVVGALFKVFLIDVDLLGVFAAVASAAIAWNQLNQHRNLVSAYSVAARELSIIRDGIDHVPDADWARFVSDSEEAISREHTMWLARHGHTRAIP
jgi:hypothetical protein